jgi:hypothetical protein
MVAVLLLGVMKRIPTKKINSRWAPKNSDTTPQVIENLSHLNLKNTTHTSTE